MDADRGPVSPLILVTGLSIQIKWQVLSRRHGSLMLRYTIVGKGAMEEPQERSTLGNQGWA